MTTHDHDRAGRVSYRDFPDHGDHHHPGVAGPGGRLVTCVVSGNPTVRSRAEADGHVRDLAAARYYFCCGDCTEVFDADPLGYAAAP